jgi:hypothetical protein
MRFALLLAAAMVGHIGDMAHDETLGAGETKDVSGVAPACRLQVKRDPSINGGIYGGFHFQCVGMCKTQPSGLTPSCSAQFGNAPNNPWIQYWYCACESGGQFYDMNNQCDSYVETWDGQDWTVICYTVLCSGECPDPLVDISGPPPYFNTPQWTDVCVCR